MELFRLPPVYPILDTASLERLDIHVCAAAEALLDGGAGILQFRHKSFWNREVVETAQGVARLCAGAGVPFVVNDRADYAALIAAGSGGPVGLHLGQEDLPPADARLVTGERVFIGFSTHNLAQARRLTASPPIISRSGRYMEPVRSSGRIRRWDWPDSRPRESWFRSRWLRLAASHATMPNIALMQGPTPSR